MKTLKHSTYNCKQCIIDKRNGKFVLCFDCDRLLQNEVNKLTGSFYNRLRPDKEIDCDLKGIQNVSLGSEIFRNNGGNATEFIELKEKN